MITRKQIIASDHRTKRGEYIDSSSFEKIARQFDDGASEIDVEHDPRTPPVGRIVSAKVVPLQDGHVGIEGEMQIFEEEDYDAPFPLQNILLRVEGHEPEHVVLRIDEHYYLNEEARADAESVAKALGVRLELQGKHSMAPPTWLTIALTCTVGAFATALFTELGKDVHKLIRERIVGLYRKHRHKDRDNLVLFEFHVRNKGEPVVVSVILTEPSDSDADTFVTSVLPFLDELLPKLLGDKEPICRLAFEFSKGELKLLYAVRKDGIPRSPLREIKRRFAP